LSRNTAKSAKKPAGAVASPGRTFADQRLAREIPWFADQGTVRLEQGSNFGRTGNGLRDPRPLQGNIREAAVLDRAPVPA
jgi:hypothetical protein